MDNEKIILDMLEKISKQLSNLDSKQSKPVPEPSRSKELKELFTALAKAQGEFNTAGLSSINPYYKSKYADLKEIVSAARPALAKYGLAFVQPVIPTSDGQNILHTLLTHNSGQWIESRMRVIPPKNDVQSLGSYITYLRRYSLASLIGIVAADEDDDGEIAVHDSRNNFNKGTKLNHKYSPKEQSYDTITKEQLEELRYALKSHTDLAEEILDKMKLQSLSDMPKNKFIVAIERIREIVQLRDGK